MNFLQKKQTRKDILAGVTAGVVALPLALAFGAASGLGPAAGLYGAIALGFFAAIFGGTRSQISGPTGPMTVVAATVIASFPKNPEIIFSVFLLAGLIQILLGVFRVGQYIKYIPYPVVSGFMSGIGIIIIFLQIDPLLGLAPSPGVVDGFLKLAHSIPKTNIEAFLLASFTIAVVYLFPKVTKQIPSTLIALILGTVISVIFALDVPTIGNIPAHLPTLAIPTFSFELFDVILIPAITLAALGTLDSLLTSVVADKLSGEKHQSNKEIVGQGIGNAISALIGGLPGAGATMRTVVNINAGGKTRLSGVVHSLVLLALLLGLGPLASRIPMAVLAGILVTVGINIIDYKSFKEIRTTPRADVFVTLTVLFATVFIDLLQAVGFGMLLASLLFVKRMGDIIDQFSRQNLLTIPWNEKGPVLSKRLTGPLFFGFSSSLEELFTEKTGEAAGAQAAVLDMREVPYIDQSGLYALEEVAKKLQKKDTHFILVIKKDQPLEILNNAKFIQDEHIHLAPSIQDVLEILRKEIGPEEDGTALEFGFRKIQPTS